MSESPIPEELFEVTDQVTEDTQLKSGYIPERWMRIEQSEVQRMRASLERNLSERAQLNAEDISYRLDTLKRHWDAEMLEPSFTGGPYALRWQLNFYELLSRVLDLKADESLVPDKDSRISFSSNSFQKPMVILMWLRDKVQEKLGEENKLTEVHLREMFTNVSQKQLNVLTQVIADSGLTLFHDTHQERWEKLVRANPHKPE